jgi:hypothetical protein
VPLIDLSARLYADQPTTPTRPTTPPQIAATELAVTPPPRPRPEPAPIPEAYGNGVRANFLMVEDRDWTWQELRDYVVHQLAERGILYPSIPAERLASIFKGFHSRWGDRAPAIVRYAFDICDGYWYDAPITPTRFAKNSDPYFAERIATRVVAA